MKATPVFRVDPDEYQSLGKIVQATARHIIAVMQAHDIGAVRRFHKNGMFGRTCTKDIVTPLGVQGVPAEISEIRNAVGSAILDYLDTVGLDGISIEATPEEISSVAALWIPPQMQQAAAEKPAGKPVQKPVGKPVQKQTQDPARQQSDKHMQKPQAEKPADGAKEA